MPRTRIGGTLLDVVAILAAATILAACQAPPADPPGVRPLPLSAVRLTGGPLRHAQDESAAYLLSLEPDRMLAYYRTRAGLVPRAEPYGGWDGDGRNLTGHIAGHYLSGVSLMYAATGDERFKARADYIVSELKIVQDANGDGYLSALAGGREAFGALSRGEIRSASFDLNGEWSPWYTLHKTFAGLRDAYRYTGNRTALDVEAKFAAWAAGILAPLSDEQIQQMLNTEFGGMNEVLVELSADTNDERWLALSYKFEHAAVLDPLKRGEDPLDGLHGNTQVPKVIGSAVRAAAIGDEADYAAARYFWDRVAHHHSFATGGHGKDEYFRTPDRIGDIVDGRTAETCNVYNMLKLTRLLFAMEPNETYAAFQERALFNHILGSIDPDDGAVCYMVPVGRGVGREYQDMQRSFTCCVGSGMESHALHADGLYYESNDRLWVNLYAPSVATWAAARARLTMETSFPEGEDATLTLDLESPRGFTLALRRPSWAGGGFAVAVNGEAVTALPGPASYVELTREWKTGDTVSLVLPKTLHLEPTPDNSRVAAIMWGPLVLAGDLGPQVERRRGAPSPAAPAVPVLVARERPVSEWVTPVPDRPGVFRTDGVGRDADVELVPFYRLHRRTYAAYWDVHTPAEYESYRAGLAAEAERLRELETRTIAFVRPGVREDDERFNLQQENTSVARVDGRTGRGGRGWFSYELPVGAAPAALVVTYHRDQRREHTFRLLVAGERVGEETVPRDTRPAFFDVAYPVPAGLVAGQPSAIVRVEAAEGSDIAPVFGIRLVRQPLIGSR